MSRIPDFSQVAFTETPAAAPAQAAPWQTPEGIAVNSTYDAAALAGLDEDIKAILHRCVALAELRDAYVAVDCLRGRPPAGMPYHPAYARNYIAAFAVPWISLLQLDVMARTQQLRANRTREGAVSRAHDAQHEHPSQRRGVARGERQAQTS